MNLKEDFKNFNIIYYALLAGQIMIAIVIVGVLNGGNLGSIPFSFGSVFTIVAAVLFAGILPLSLVLYKQGIKEAKTMDLSLSEKFTHYRMFCTRRLAMLEGPAMISMVLFFLENNYFFLFLFAIELLLFSQLRPTPEQFSEDFNLSVDEQRTLQTQMK